MLGLLSAFRLKREVVQIFKRFFPFKCICKIIIPFIIFLYCTIMSPVDTTHCASTALTSGSQDQSRLVFL